MYRSGTGSGQSCNKKGKQWVAGKFGYQKTTQSADNHRSFNAKIEDTRALGKYLTQGGIEDRSA